MRRPPTFPVILAGSAAFLDLYATQPLLPLLARTFNASTFKVGLTVTAPTVAVALSAPFIGRLADRLWPAAGDRRLGLHGRGRDRAAATSTTLAQLDFLAVRARRDDSRIFAGTIAYIHEEWPAERAGRGTAA
jgi:MFS family permease